MPHINENFSADICLAVERSELSSYVIPIASDDLRRILVRSKIYDHRCADYERCVVRKPNYNGA